MSNGVSVSVRSDLQKIIDDLIRIREAAAETNRELGESGNAIEDGINKNVKNTENFLSQLRGYGRRVADQLRGDFKSLFAINAIGDAMKISNQFRGAISQTVALSDTIRKLGPVFNIASQDFARFQSKMTKGLGDIGLSGDVAARALTGLAETQVRGDENLLGYSRMSGMLASISREQGSEGEIASGMAAVIQARGGNVNNMSEVDRLAESLRKVFVTTGKGPTETLKNMEQIFSRMPKDLRQSLSSQGLQSLMTASAVAGPNSTKFLEEYLSKSKIDRLPFDLQGGANIFGDQGLNIEEFRKFSQNIMGRIGQDPRKAAETLGLSEEAAEGFIRLAEQLDRVSKAQNEASRAIGSVNEQFRASRGLAESFRANINRVTSMFSGAGSQITQGVTNLLSKTSESDTGSLLTTGAAAAAAAAAAGWGIKTLGNKAGLGGITGAVVKGGVAEGLTGQSVQPVYVVNAGEIAAMSSIGGAAAGAGKLGGFLSLLKKGGLLAGAGMAGFAIGELIKDPLNEFLDKHMSREGAQGEKSNILDSTVGLVQAANPFSDYTGKDWLRDYYGDHYKKQYPEGHTPAWAQQQKASQMLAKSRQDIKLKVELNKRDLKVSKQPTGGASY
jgi:hypothetical protein